MNIVIIFAAIIIILAGIKAAASLITPLLLAFFITIIISPFFLFLKKKKLPQGLAITIVMVVLFGVLWLLVVFLGNSVHDFTQNVPKYEAKLHQDMVDILEKLSSYGVEIPKESIMEIFATDQIMGYISKGLKSFSALLTNFFLITVTVVFLLMEIANFSKKLKRTNLKILNSIVAIAEHVKQFILLKSLTSLATGVIVAVSLKLLGIDYALLWGLVAFLLNFIPNIGSIIAAVPAVLMALVQYDFSIALIVIALYIVINITIGSIIEPRIMGEGLGLSTLVVFLSLVVWGWLLGPVGMLLSVPLTIMIKIILYEKKETRQIAILLGN